MAAKGIKELIGASVASMNSGAGLARGAQLVAEIGSASVEQSSGSSQIADVVAPFDRVTRQNAAMAEQSAAIAESLQHRADRLGDAISVFAQGDSLVAPA